VNAPVLPHFLPGYFCIQIVSAPHMIVLVLPHFLAACVCAQCECAGVAAFFSWLFLRPNSDRAPNVNSAFFTWPFLR